MQLEHHVHPDHQVLVEIVDGKARIGEVHAYQGRRQKNRLGTLTLDKGFGVCLTDKVERLVRGQDQLAIFGLQAPEDRRTHQTGMPRHPDAFAAQIEDGLTVSFRRGHFGPPRA